MTTKQKIGLVVLLAIIIIGFYLNGQYELEPHQI